MKKAASLILVVGALALASFAFAVNNPRDNSNYPSSTMPGSPTTTMAGERIVMGTVAEVDLKRNTITLRSVQDESAGSSMSAGTERENVPMDQGQSMIQGTRSFTLGSQLQSESSVLKGIHEGDHVRVQLDSQNQIVSIEKTSK